MDEAVGRVGLAEAHAGLVHDTDRSPVIIGGNIFDQFGRDAALHSVAGRPVRMFDLDCPAVEDVPHDRDVAGGHRLGPLEHQHGIPRWPVTDIVPALGVVPPHPGIALDLDRTDLFDVLNAVQIAGEGGRHRRCEQKQQRS